MVFKNGRKTNKRERFESANKDFERKEIARLE